MIPRQLLANPGGGGEQDLAPLSPFCCQQGGCVRPGGGSQGEAGGGCFSSSLQPKGIWRVDDQGGKAFGSLLPRGPEMKAFWFKFREEFRIMMWIY